MLAHPARGPIETALRAACGEDVRITGLEPVGGGCSHEALSIHSTRGRFFVKIDARERGPVFAAEADGLAAIAATRTFRTPAVVACTEDEQHAFLILEHLDLHPVQDAAHATRYGETLAALHGHQGEQFGWPADNFLGASPQANTPTDNWARFVVEQRLRPQFARARANGFIGDLQKQGARLYERVPALFLDYRPRPSLLHGDLWHGNAAVLADGTPVAFDPAVHHGDREADLAMCELFGGFPGAFYAAYRSAAPLNEGFEQRKQLYSLYHILNHLNLFGRGYLGEALRLATRLNDTLGARRG
ncbi:fructosamine kinase family protein [Pseudothauera nasutitermitis]|uniref:Fructosamine kinase family protein n=1 Tax=Pseudothauera nasutitermitis TaxID=2565930 RepID=A0A4S4B2I1_9RHOO|nr:fructosamine kinase family protein [Pseudothauera nasutitermitis]THF65897.1 fructosamine kinase family protein [Pseudothauera nasutitermitis]